MKNNYLLVGFIISTAALSAANAQTAATIEANGSASSVNYDNAVITAILSQPGTGDGYTYKTWAFLATDGSASLEVYVPSSATSALGSYTPTVGDSINLTGASYAPFDGLPEISFLSTTSVSLNSQGNAVSGPIVTTIPAINVGGVNAEGLVPSPGYLLELDNVTLSGATTFGSHANTTLSVSDGVNSMALYQWASSYSTAGALGGTTVPTGPVDIDGFVDYFAGSTEEEFIPTSITAVPEPTSIALCGVASVLGLAGYRLRKKA